MAVKASLSIQKAPGISLNIGSQLATKIIATALAKVRWRAKNSEVELRFVKSGEMKKLNKKFRGKNKPTDVLSFEVHRHGLLGMIMIDVETAARQAKEYRHSVRQEVRELFVHGICHLLGHDHEKPVDAKKMEKLERGLNRLWTR